MIIYFELWEQQLFNGTGSIPPSKRGLHLRILFTPKYIPLNKPCLLNASIQ